MKIRNLIGRFKAKKIFLFLAAGLLVLYVPINCFAASHPQRTLAAGSDTAGSSAVKAQLALHLNDLDYPLSVERFYRQLGYKLQWIAPDTVKTHASEAMLMLDCVLQFGLNYADYHSQYLTYQKLNLLTQKFSKQSDNSKAAFDIILTDALITYINHLHYGKLNPDYPAAKIDQGASSTFDAAAILNDALKQKKTDFMKMVLSAQPQTAAYKKLQYHMYLLAGLYTGDCYDTPDSVVRKMAINMERLRWVNSSDQTYIDINIPSYTLQFHQPDTTYQFKVVVGKPETPTPALQSAIGYFTTAPEWRVPQKIFIKETLPKALKNIAYLENSHYAIYDDKGNYILPTRANLLAVKRNPGKYHARQSSGCDNSLGLIVFRFPNIYDVYLHDTPEQKLFKKAERAFSHGCIRVEQAENLADLLLKNDGADNRIASVHKAIAAYRTMTFTLRKPVPISITYITCEVQNGKLVTYKDIYNLDKRLEMALYNMEAEMAMKP